MSAPTSETAAPAEPIAYPETAIDLPGDSAVDAVVTTAVARGDLTRTVTVDATGEMLELKLTVNTMVEQLSAFADEVTRVAVEVGTEGRLGGQARVRGVSGTWKDLTESVNVMASNLTYQVRNIAQVATAVARGDLSQKITVDVKGELLELKTTINAMVDTLSAFADEVTRVAREVGTEGQLGGQARVRGASGVWKDLTDNVNAMANNLTYQVRNIGFGAGVVGQAAVEKKRLMIVDAPADYLKISSGLGEAPPACVVVLPIVFEDEALGVIELAAFSRFSDVHLAFFDQFVHTIGVAINTIIAN